MRRPVVCFALILILLASCESLNYAPPPITLQMARASARQHVDLATLRQGRALFVSRCIDCHTLPEINDHPSAEWPGLVKRMAKRADLKPNEYDAIVAYILAAKQH